MFSFVSNVLIWTSGCRFKMFLQVSFGSELSNRAPTFDMDLSDFMDGDKPISYDKAKEYFSQDPSQK
jgi:hypothetical protein